MNLEDRVITLFHNTMDIQARTIEHYTPLITHASQILQNALQSESKIICLGNGGSSALAQHFSSLLLNRFRHDRPGLPVLNLGSDFATASGIAEESSFSDTYAKQIRALGQPGDILLILSNQGRSNSLVQAVQAAHDRELGVIALTGNRSSNISALLRADEVEICIESEDRALIYGTHLLILHCFCDLIEYQLFGV